MVACTFLRDYQFQSANSKGFHLAVNSWAMVTPMWDHPPRINKPFSFILFASLID